MSRVKGTEHRIGLLFQKRGWVNRDPEQGGQRIQTEIKRSTVCSLLAHGKNTVPPLQTHGENKKRWEKPLLRGIYSREQNHEKTGGLHCLLS